MGLVRKADVDTVATGEPGSVDMSAVIRQAVAAEIERQRLAKVQADVERDVDLGDESP